MENKKKIIGVLGGMGPQASAEFYSILIEKSINDYGAVNNDDFPEILLDSVPVPDFISNTKRLTEASLMLTDRVRRMNIFGVKIICIACNTAHILLPELRRFSRVPIVSVIEEMKRMIKMNGYKRVGLLASIMTYKMSLYNGIGVNNLKIYQPTISEKKAIEEIIRAVIKGENRSILREQLLSLATGFIKRQRLDTIILGCTELPLIFPKLDFVKVINTTEVLADSLLKFYYQVEKL